MSSRPRSTVRIAVVAACTTLLLTGLLVPVFAHGGIVPQPRVTGTPDVDGLTARGLVAYAPRIEVDNPSEDEVEVVDDAGRPWLRIGADGVHADLSVRAWYESLDSSGRGIDPPQDAPEGWTRVSTLSTWQWFDTVLLPRTGDEGHRWSIPAVVRGEFTEFTGELEESDLEGRWATDLGSDGAVGPSQLTVVSGPVPVFIVQRLDAEEVIVLGREDEPVLRLTEAGFEVNRASPTWNDHARLDPNSPVGDVVEDPSADPVWEMQLADSPTATWLDVRAASPDVVPGRRDATRLQTSIPVIVDGERFDVPVTTSWVGDEVPLVRVTLPVLVAASLGAGLLAAGAVRLWEVRRERRSDDADDAAGSPAAMSLD